MDMNTCKEFILEHDRFVLAAHRSPDGDTLGSCLAMRLALIDLNKDAVVVCEDYVPDYLQFLPGSNEIVSEPYDSLEAVLYIDCAEHSRAGQIASSLENAPFQFCIDHHETNPRCSKDGDWVEDVGATAEMIYRLIQALNVTVTKDIAVCLYAGISTDTGNFSYSNTTSDTFRIASELMLFGIDPEDMNRRLFRSISLPKAKLISCTLGSARILDDGLISIACITMKAISAAGAKESDCEGLIDYLRDIDTVEVACLLRESKDGTVKGSLRSKKGANVLLVARHFQGGGHAKAAGFTFNGSLEEAENLVVPIILETVEIWKESYQF